MDLKTLVIDDDSLSRGFLERYCQKTCGIQLMASFEDAQEALQYIDENPIDLLFLDVEMPNITGFQLLDKLISQPKVILTTSKTDYAYDAFQYGVIDFIKKPISFSRFSESILKVKELTAVTNAVQGTNNTQNEQEDEIFIKADGKLTRLNYKDILYIECIGDYVKFFTIGKNFITLGPLKLVEERIVNEKFMKVHRSYIVNLQQIKDIQDNTILIDGKIIPISKAHKSTFLNRIRVI